LSISQNSAQGSHFFYLFYFSLKEKDEKKERERKKKKKKKKKKNRRGDKKGELVPCASLCESATNFSSSGNWNFQESRVWVLPFVS